MKQLSPKLVEFMKLVAAEADRDIEVPIFKVMNAIMTAGGQRSLALGDRERFWRDLLDEADPEGTRVDFGTRLLKLIEFYGIWAPPHCGRCGRVIDGKFNHNLCRGSDVKQHKLKTWSEAFDAILIGAKKHELRKNDRPYAVGDELVLLEFVPCSSCHGTGRVWDNGDEQDCGCTFKLHDEAGKPLHGRYTGREMSVRVTYCTPGGTWGLPQDLCCMSISVLP